MPGPTCKLAVQPDSSWTPASGTWWRGSNPHLVSGSGRRPGCGLVCGYAANAGSCHGRGFPGPVALAAGCGLCVELTQDAAATFQPRNSLERMLAGPLAAAHVNELGDRCGTSRVWHPSLRSRLARRTLHSDHTPARQLAFWVHQPGRIDFRTPQAARDGRCPW